MLKQTKKSLPVLLTIQRKLPDLSGNFRTIAERILAEPEQVIHEKASDLAKRSGVDSAQVVRLCQKLGFHGFPDLKSKIMEGYLDQWNTLNRQIAPQNNPIHLLKQHFQEDFTKTINDTLAELNETDLKKTEKLLSGAKRIYIAGCGASSLAARDMQIKLLRIDFTAIFLDDLESMRMLCPVLSPEDLLVVISFSGTTESMLELAENARKNAVPVLSLTNYPDSPLAEKSTLCLLTTADEEKLRVGAMTSILSQFLVVDVLISLLAGLNRERTEKRVSAMNFMADDFRDIH